MKNLKINQNKHNENIHDTNRGNDTHDDLSSATLSTISTMSSSEDYSQFLVEHDRSRKNIRHTTRKQQKQKSNNKIGTGRSNRKGKRVSKATSNKPHDAPMQRKDIYFALDCEMVGVGREGLDSVLARVSVVNWDNEIVFDTFVKVDEPVTDYRTFVSGITPEQIQSDSAIAIRQVQTIVSTILQGKILIGHGLENDLKVMGIYHPLCDRRDTATYTPYMRTQESRTSDDKITVCPRKLKDLVWEKLGKKIQVIGKAHSPVEDAISAMDLYKADRNEWEVEMARQANVENQMSNCNNTRHPFKNITQRSPASFQCNELSVPIPQQFLPNPYGHMEHSQMLPLNRHAYPPQYYASTQPLLFATRYAQEQGHTIARSDT
mmetsp:Transcript_24148/g.29736  ORF Transcript_24148/g.29736 Transcript_24148/m.29736 type:complete len:377 (-) Transcript_24148:111-1241(-)